MPRTLGVLLILSLALGLTFAEITPLALRKAGSLCAKGSKSLADGDVDKASQAFEEALKAVPDYPDAHIGLGDVALRGKNFEGALREYQAAREGIVKLGDLMKAREMEQQRSNQQAADSLRDQSAYASSPGVKSGAASLTTTLGAKEAQARDAATKTVDNKSDVRIPAELYYKIGNVQFMLRRADEARESWESCIKSDPKFGRAYGNLAIVEFQAGHLDKAQEYVNEAEKLGASVNPNLKNDLAKALASRPKP